MLSGRGLRDELITRPEESYRLCCVVVCDDLETSRIGDPYIYDISNLRVNSFRMNVRLYLDVCWGQGEETAIFMPSKPCYIFHIYIVFRIINMMKKATDI